MKLTKVEHVEDFMRACDMCKSDVYLKSLYGDVYNIKSKLQQYIGVGELLKDYGDELELFCACKEDEVHFMRFFKDYQEVNK